MGESHHHPAQLTVIVQGLALRAWTRKEARPLLVALRRSCGMKRED
jgi:hypothetical protein